jgi:hypothetical protein
VTERRFEPVPARPRRAARLVETTLRGRRVLYDPTARRVLELRPDVDALWQLFDGHTSVELLIEEFAEVAEVCPDEARTYLRHVVDELRRAGLLETVAS